MAFNVNFWTFSKKEKSTAQPAGQATVYSCVANGDLDLLAPRVRLNVALNTSSKPTGFNYAQIPAFGRYYHVTGWTVRDGLWEAQLQVDPWASWKTEIGSSSLYVYRAASDFNGHVVDTLYPTTSDVVFEQISTSTPLNGIITCTVGMDHVVGIIGKNNTSVEYRIFTWAQLTKLLDYLFSDGYYVDQLGIFGSTDASAKVAVNPLQYITSIRAYPGNLTASAVLETGYYVGMVQMVPLADGVPFTCYKLVDGNTGLETHLIKEETTLQLNQLGGHPQSARGNWINAAHGKYVLTAPPFGTVVLDPVLVAQSYSIDMVGMLDIATGMARLSVYYDRGGTVDPPETVYSDPLIVEARIGVEVPLSQITSTGYGLSQIGRLLPSVLSTVAGVASGNPFLIAGGMLSAGESAIGGLTEARIQKASHTGAQGSVLNYNMLSALWAEYTLLVDDDNASNGRPLCEVRQINTLSGFIQAQSDELSLACTGPELEAVRSGIAAGFFYE